MMKTTIVTIALGNSSQSPQLIGELRNDDSNGYDHATKQIFDWLNEEKNRAARATRFLVQLFDVVCQATTSNFHS